jgi:hypothetical protein
VNDVTYSLNYVRFQASPNDTFILELVHYKLKTISIMGNLLYVVAVILLIAWAVGFFAFSLGSVIHILLVIALVAIILRVIQGRKILN